MLARVYSGAVYGVDAYAVEIEVNAGFGDPSVVIVGLPDAAVRESKDRVWTAVLNSGFKPPMGRTTINLAPATVKKEGPSFDLPIAVGMLVANEQVNLPALESYGLVGELALGGEVRRVRGVLPIVMEMRRLGKRGVLVPLENAEEAAVVSGIAIHPVGICAKPWTSWRAATRSRRNRWTWRRSAGRSWRMPMISRTSRGRRAPSALSRWPSAAGTTS
jgi:magnesium chelatase family protein